MYNSTFTFILKGCTGAFDLLICNVKGLFKKCKGYVFKDVVALTIMIVNLIQ